MKPGKNWRKENKETNTHTPMPRHAQKKKKKKPGAEKGETVLP